MFVRLSVLFSLLWVSCFISQTNAQDLADTIERCEQSVVRIEVTEDDGRSLGSGFVVDDNGTFVTNCHVLEGAKTARVTFPKRDGVETTGEVLGTFLIDQSRDIVIGKLSVTSQPAIELATELPRKGDRVTALGSPRGLSFTATTGIVSAVRSQQEMADEVGDTERRGTWIQVDAALSGGNSGGPLINAKGEVVAMSTLASIGAAQNLNFGISAADIKQAVSQASGKPLTSLADGVGKIKSKESHRAAGSEGLVPHREVPESALEGYIAEGKTSFSDLLLGLRREAASLTAKMKEMRAGQPFIPPAVGQAKPNSQVVRVVDTRRRGNNQWFFRSENVKRDVIAKSNERFREISRLKTDIKSADDPESLYELLWNAGPPLDIRKDGSIGFVNEAIVIHAYNSHDLLVVIDDSIYLMWVESTAGLALGEEVLPGPVFVNGTATVQVEETSQAVTVLQAVTKDELKRGLLGGVRTWKDTSGNFSVKAKYLSSDTKQVKLQDEGGKELAVPIHKLSDADQRLLKLYSPPPAK